MFCTTECWNCEDKNCKNYISKQELYFENQQLKDRNKLLEKHYTQLEKDYGEELGRNIVYKSVLDEIREVINQNMISYSSCIKAFDEIEEILRRFFNEKISN